MIRPSIPDALQGHYQGLSSNLEQDFLLVPLRVVTFANDYVCLICAASERWHCQKLEYDFDYQSGATLPHTVGVDAGQSWIQNLSWSTLLLLHYSNYCLWHLEQQCRPDLIEAKLPGSHVHPEKLGHKKLAINSYNQARVDTVNQINHLILKHQRSFGYLTGEMPGDVLDRMSILCLKMLHLVHKLVLGGPDGDELKTQLAGLQQQHGLQVRSFVELCCDIEIGRRRCLDLQQFKDYDQIHQRVPDPAGAAV